MTVDLKIEVMDSALDLAPLAYQTPGASGLDLRSAFDHYIGARGYATIPTGIKVEIPPGYEGQVRSRSGLAHKKGMFVLNSPGTIDSDYRGEIMVILANFSNDLQTIKRGDRIAQLVICPVEKANLIITGLSKTERGEGGLGSTGTG